MVLQVNAPWAEGSSRFTLAMECWCIDVLGECEVSSAGRLTGLEWHSMWLLMEHAVSRGKARKKRKLPSRIGVDEKSFAKRHKYETLICDLDKSTVEHVAEGRCQESLEGYLVSFTEEERQAVTAVALDMWDPYIAALRAKIPDADEKLVFDRYHVMTQVTKAVDQIRKQEHRELQEEGDERLSKTKYLWLSNRENVPRWKRAGFAELRKQKLKVGRAWSIKEALRTLWDYARYGWAKKFLKRWYFWASHSRLGPMIKAGRTIKRYQKGVLNYIHHGITNAAVEGLNSKIETIKRMACGYRNRQNYRTAIYFHLGGLNLYPEGEWGPSLHLGGTH
jgi:transposase